MYIFFWYVKKDCFSTLWIISSNCCFFSLWSHWMKTFYHRRTNKFYLDSILIQQNAGLLLNYLIYYCNFICWKCRNVYACSLKTQQSKWSDIFFLVIHHSHTSIYILLIKPASNSYQFTYHDFTYPYCNCNKYKNKNSFKNNTLLQAFIVYHKNHVSFHHCNSCCSKKNPVALILRGLRLWKSHCFDLRLGEIAN